MLRGNGVGFEASKVHFSSTSVVDLCSRKREEAPKTKEVGASTSTEQRGSPEDSTTVYEEG